MRSAVLLALLMPCVALRTSSMKAKEEPEVAIDDLDEMEYEQDLELAKSFQPTTELVAEWKDAFKNKGPSATKVFAKVEQALPDQCTAQIHQWVNSAQPHGPAHPDVAWIHEHSECQDPFKGNAQKCGSAYEVPLYRLADVVLYRPNNLPEYLENFFPESIGAKFVRKTNGMLHQYEGSAGKKKAVDILNQVISGPEYDSFEKPAADELVVHLRLGDAFKEFLRDDHYYRGMVSEAKKLGIKKVTLVYGDHTITQFAKMNHQEPTESTASTGKRWKWNGEYLQKAMKRIPEVEGIFTKAGFPVEKRINFNADCDVIYMAKAKHFGKAGGGFSNVVASLVKKQGGQVLGK